MDEIEIRLAAVESLIGAIDRDNSDLTTLLRVQTPLLQALRETQNETNAVLGHQGLALGEMVIALTKNGQRLSSIDRRVGAVEGHLREVDHRLAALQEGQAALQEGQAEILRRLPNAG